jgi:hypothetical protein
MEAKKEVMQGIYISGHPLNDYIEFECNILYTGANKIHKTTLVKMYVLAISAYLSTIQEQEKSIKRLG